MLIYGAGMAGLLCANMLRRLKPVVYEAQSSLPNNHSALLRFRSDTVSRATGVPFKRVMVHKAVCYERKLYSQTNLMFNNLYSYKVTGQTLDRSIINLAPAERFVAPLDFIAQISASVKLVYSSKLDADGLMRRERDAKVPLVSTVPMPLMMQLVGWQDVPQFTCTPVWSLRCEIPHCDVYQTLYYPDLKDAPYRASITGDTLIIEYLHRPQDSNLNDEIKRVMEDFGIKHLVLGRELKEQKLGKLVPLSDPMVGRRFMLYLTDRFRIYSLGRFATWRTLLLDDVVKDVGVIERMIESRDAYENTLARSAATTGRVS